MNDQIKQYLVQVRCDYGYTYAEMMPYPSIIDKAGMTDCSGEELEVYDVSEFGKVEKLTHSYGKQPNHHIFTKNGEVVFEGNSPEH